MSNVATCPTCGSTSKIKETNEEITYETIQDDELIIKIDQLKKALRKCKVKAAQLEKQLEGSK
ncbi:hypothetical protein [Maribacter polysaccharolyticus]|uniref:hypothetical protein n=1 Tax=Maribacter polysaccharolyticus TaxID=3020831 RepID=UPI00237F3AEA|nr:hypothetical protein [Maribacter polysaccharolyticus]MDE3743425.1 hypothetical protein [Maribacter polysaccharolyticus]